MVLGNNDGKICIDKDICISQSGAWFVDLESAEFFSAESSKSQKLIRAYADHAVDEFLKCINCISFMQSGKFLKESKEAKNAIASAVKQSDFVSFSKRNLEFKLEVDAIKSSFSAVWNDIGWDLVNWNMVDLDSYLP